MYACNKHSLYLHENINIFMKKCSEKMKPGHLLLRSCVVWMDMQQQQQQHSNDKNKRAKKKHQQKN